MNEDRYGKIEGGISLHICVPNHLRKTKLIFVNIGKYFDKFKSIQMERY